MEACASRQTQVRTKRFCWSDILTPTCPSRQQQLHTDLTEDVRALLNNVSYYYCLSTLKSSITYITRIDLNIKKVCPLFMTTPYCDASFGSCFKSSFNFDIAACKATMQIIRPINKQQ